jgi:hypothetical protein
MGIIDELGVRMNGVIAPAAEAGFSLKTLNDAARHRVETTGKALSKDGGYVLHPGASVTVPPFTLGEGLTRVLVKSELLTLAQAGEVALRKAEEPAVEPPIFLVSRNGSSLDFTLDGKKLSLGLTPDAGLSINIFRVGNRIELTCLGQTAVMEQEGADFPSLSITVRNPEDAPSSFRLSDVLIRTGTDDPLNRLLDVIDTGKKP